MLGLRALEPALDITGVGPRRRSRAYPGPFVRPTPPRGLPFADGEFDLVYCSSVIEHVPPARRAAFAAELRRVGRGWMVQTPASLVPDRAPLAAARAPTGCRCALRRRYWRLGAAGGWEEISLLAPRASSKALFGPARPERLGPLVKSWVSVRPPLRAAQPPGG